MPCYKLYGLSIESDIEFKGLIASENPANVCVYNAILPELLPNLVYKSSFFETSKGKMLIRFRQQVRFLISDGCNVQYQILSNYDTNELQQFMLGPVMAALIHQRGDIPLHASAVEVNDRAVLFAGETGSGKSTLAASVMQLGYRLLADDVSVVDFDINKCPFIYPAIPLFKLWDDSATELMLQQELLMKLGENIEKKGIAVDNFCTDSKPLKTIFILKKGAAPNISFTQIKGAEKLKWLNEVIFRSYFMRGLGTEQIIFEKMTNIARCAEVFVVSRPQNTFDLGTLTSKIQEMF